MQAAYSFSLNKTARQISVLLLFMTLSACFSTRSAQMNTTLQAVAFLNPNIYHKPAPVVITLYQLKAPAAFQHSSFFALYNAAPAALSGDLLDKQSIEIRPQQKQTLNIALTPQTSYIGVVAAFRNPDKAQWRKIVAVTPGKNSSLHINVATQSIALKLN